MQTLLAELPVVVPDGLLAQVLTDANDAVCGYNARFADLLGREIPLGLRLETLFEEAVAQEVSDVLRCVMHGVPHHVAWPVVSMRGRARHSEWHLRPRYKRGGEVIGVEITVIPVEAQRRELRRLHEATTRFRQLASGLAAMVWVGDPASEIDAANRAWHEFVGEGHGTSWERLIHPEDREQVRACRAGARRDEPAITTYRMRRADGQWRWVEERVLAQDDEDGESRVVGSCNDVTEQREVRARLEQQVALTQGILNAAQDAVVTVDERQRILSFNPAAEEMFGRPQSEMIGRAVTELMPSRFRAGHDARVSGFAQRGSKPSRVPAAPGLNGLRADGSEFPIEIAVSAVVTPGGRRVTAIIRDMTSYARAIQALQDRETRLRMAMESANLGSAEVDVATGRCTVSEVSARVLGLPADPAQWFLRHFMDPVHAEDIHYVAGLVQSLIGDPTPDKSLDAEFRIIRPDGTVRWVYARGRLHRDAQGVPRRISGVLMDIHERKQNEEQLRMLSQRLLAAQEDERRNIARELHDQIGQALTAALINLQMLPAMPESAEMHATLASVLQQVRELSLNLRPSMLDSLGLEPALRWYLDRQRNLGKFEFELSCPPDRLPSTTETVLFRLVQEAITNILRHARASEVRVLVEVTGEEAVLTVRDNGVGFDPKAILARAVSGGSFGVLGMTERAQLAGGTLTFDSTPGQGATVTAVLPLR